MKDMLAIWLVSFYDSSADVAVTARKNFETCFPPNKRAQAFHLGSKNLLKFAVDQLKTGEDSMAESSVELSQKQKEEVFDRIIAGTFYALAESFSLVSQWSEVEE